MSMCRNGAKDQKSNKAHTLRRVNCIPLKLKGLFFSEFEEIHQLR